MTRKQTLKKKMIVNLKIFKKNYFKIITHNFINKFLIRCLI